MDLYRERTIAICRHSFKPLYLCWKILRNLARRCKQSAHEFSLAFTFRITLSQHYLSKWMLSSTPEQYPRRHYLLLGLVIRATKNADDVTTHLQTNIHYTPVTLPLSTSYLLTPHLLIAPESQGRLLQEVWCHRETPTML